MVQTTTRPTLILKGKSGKEYTFTVYPWPTEFKKVAGLYLFTRIESNKTTHTFIYLGLTGDLSERFDTHHKMQCINRNGVTNISVMVLEGEAARDTAEKDILAINTPLCNEKLVKGV